MPHFFELTINVFYIIINYYICSHLLYYNYIEIIYPKYKALISVILWQKLNTNL